MSQVRVHNFSISLDGFGTGDGITFDAPFGHAGERLHEWMFATRFWRSMVGDPGASSGVDHSFADRHGLGFGAEIMGRGKFGAQTGPWTDVGTDDEWRGWWGPNPPFHTPVFVLTHHRRPSIEMEGGTVFHFVDANPQEALDLARKAAGDLDVRIGGGPTVVRDFLAADLIDTLHVVQVPMRPTHAAAASAPERAVRRTHTRLFLAPPSRSRLGSLLRARRSSAELVLTAWSDRSRSVSVRQHRRHLLHNTFSYSLRST